MTRKRGKKNTFLVSFSISVLGFYVIGCESRREKEVGRGMGWKSVIKAYSICIDGAGELSQTLKCSDTFDFCLYVLRCIAKLHKKFHLLFNRFL